MHTAAGTGRCGLILGKTPEGRSLLRKVKQELRKK
jgi:hypothetical protein